ncbi:MAG: EF-P lysine aminoacylase GenX [Lentisphaeria bacterium]|nr:EF-P lysine aminoacylase GenX [Lentisphaeria bacterium]
MPNVSAKADQESLCSALLFRSEVLRETRAYYHAHGFAEVETPVVIEAPAIEEYIEAPRLTTGAFLRSSPELEMKRLLAAGMERIYELSPCFRAGEHGRRHRCEFTMLEWYMAHTDYMELLDFTKGLFRHLATALKVPEHIFNPHAEWEIISVRDAFRNFAGEDADKCAETESLFEQVLVEKVEPALPQNVPCVLMDYPVRFGAFARKKAEDPTLAERWEVYYNGIELGNAYGELVDAEEQIRRFAEYAEKRKLCGLTEYPQPVEFLDAIRSGIPDSAGCAIGFDRLVMVLAGTDDIENVTFPHR